MIGVQRSSRSPEFLSPRAARQPGQLEWGARASGVEGLRHKLPDQINHTRKTSGVVLKVGTDEVGLFAPPVSQRNQPLPDRPWEVENRAVLHTIASRYGRITVHTLHTFAEAVSSSTVALRSRRQSRSASIATSRPTLLRYLKQSATVFAGP